MKTDTTSAVDTTRKISKKHKINEKMNKQKQHNNTLNIISILFYEI